MIPEWVHVWTWARVRGEVRAFPQQEHWGAQAREPMSMADYDALVTAWKAAGSPRVPLVPIKNVDAA